MNTANYFPLLTHHYASQKSLNIRMIYGLEGYGIYLIMCQKLVATKARRMKLDQVDELAFELHLEQKTINLREFITKYFDLIGEEFYSQELNESLVWYDAKYNKSSEGGKKAAENMTPEQRKERSEIANQEKKKKQELQKSDKSLVNLKPNPLGDTKEELLTNLGETPNNRIEKNRIEENKIESEINKREKTEINRTEEKETDSMDFSDLIEVQESVESYQSSPSKFFFGDNQNVVINTYYDYCRNYPNTKMPISKFEKRLYFSLLQKTLSINAVDLNKYISNHPISIQAYDLFNTIKLINENPEVKKSFLNDIKEVIAQ